MKIELESIGSINPDSILRNSLEERTGIPPPASTCDRVIGINSMIQIENMVIFADITILLFCIYRI